MEISTLSKSSIRIKGKTSILVVDPENKIDSNAVLLLDPNNNFDKSEGILIKGPGEYETGGVKITGIKGETGLAYNITIDNLTILLGNLSTLEKIHTKLKESNILIVNSNEVIEATFLTGLVTNAIIFYGEKSAETAKSFGKENVSSVSKYVTTIDKLPAEVEAMILE